MKESGPYLPGSVWTYLDAFGLFVAGLFGSLVAIALGVAVNGGEELADVPLLITSSLGQAVVLAAILMYMSRSRGTDSWELDFGWRFEKTFGVGGEQAARFGDRGLLGDAGEDVVQRALFRRRI